MNKISSTFSIIYYPLIFASLQKFIQSLKIFFLSNWFYIQARRVSYSKFTFLCFIRSVTQLITKHKISISTKIILFAIHFVSNSNHLLCCVIWDAATCSQLLLLWWTDIWWRRRLLLRDDDDDVVVLQKRSYPFLFYAIFKESIEVLTYIHVSYIKNV